MIADLGLAAGSREAHAPGVSFLLRALLTWTAVSVVVGPLVGSMLAAGAGRPAPAELLVTAPARR